VDLSVAAKTLDAAKHRRACDAALAKEIDDRGVGRLKPRPIALIDEDSQELTVLERLRSLH